MDLTANLRRLGTRFWHGGIPWAWDAFRDRVRPERPAFLPQARTSILGRHGVEIGGPSRVFRPREALPVYDWAESIDNVNFSVKTTWEHGLRDGAAFPFNRRRAPGRQWIREATDLRGIADGAYEFVVSSHCLEHVANPLAALAEWLRVARAGALLVLIVPNPARSFDHCRPITTLAHLREDLRCGTQESDLGHLAEVLQLHDLARDPGAGGPAEFRARSERNATNRCMHQHVFDPDLVAASLRETGWSVLVVERIRPVHLMALARKAIA
jgi:SAM-dependent methyltransferase